MIKKFRRKQEQKKFYRTNERIFASTLRVLDTNGSQIGILPKYEALSHARQLGLDLVEIAPTAKPPVAKIIDFKKFLYQEEKKKREEKKKAKSSETKEVRLGPFMSDNDLSVMVKRAREFIEEGDKVRLVVKFKGRQITKQQFGNQVLNKVIESLSDIAKVEKEARMEGRQLVAILSHEKKTGAKVEAEKNYETEEKNQKISSPQV